jgi:hypothetical protein
VTPIPRNGLNLFDELSTTLTHLETHQGY